VVVVLFLFKGRYALPAKLVVGVALIVAGLLTSAWLLCVVGAVVLVLVPFGEITGRRRRARDLDE
jgi:hypothetical protein